MRFNGKAFQIVWGVVKRIFVFMMYMTAVRNRPVVVDPNLPVKALAIAEWIPTPALLCIRIAMVKTAAIRCLFNPGIVWVDRAGDTPSSAHSLSPCRKSPIGL